MATLKLLILFAVFVACYADSGIPFATFEKKNKPSLEGSAAYGHPVWGGAGASVGLFTGDSEKQKIPIFPPSGIIPGSPDTTTPTTTPATSPTSTPATSPTSTPATPTPTLPPVTATSTAPATVTQTAPTVTVTASPTLPPVTVTVTPTPPGTTTPPGTCAPPPGPPSCGCSDGTSAIDTGKAFESSIIKCIIEAVKDVKKP